MSGSKFDVSENARVSVNYRPTFGNEQGLSKCIALLAKVDGSRLRIDTFVKWIRRGSANLVFNGPSL